MYKDLNKNDTSYEDFSGGFTNSNFANDVSDFADRKDNNINTVNSIRSTNSGTSSANPIANYLLGGNFSSSEIKCVTYDCGYSKNYIRKSSFFTEESQNFSEQLENNISLTPKIDEEKKDEENSESVSKKETINPPSLLIMEKIVGKTLYTLYQDLKDYHFSIVRYTLKNVKNRFKSNRVIIRNNAYLDNIAPVKDSCKGKANDIVKNFDHYRNYFASLGEW